MTIARVTAEASSSTPAAPRGSSPARTYSKDDPGCDQGDGIFSGMAGMGQYVDLNRIHVG
jgi:hypothetical protein